MGDALRAQIREAKDIRLPSTRIGKRIAFTRKGNGISILRATQFRAIPVILPGRFRIRQMLMAYRIYQGMEIRRTTSSAEGGFPVTPPPPTLLRRLTQKYMRIRIRKLPGYP